MHRLRQLSMMKVLCKQFVYHIRSLDSLQNNDNFLEY